MRVYFGTLARNHLRLARRNAVAVLVELTAAMHCAVLSAAAGKPADAPTTTPVEDWRVNGPGGDA